MSIKTVNEVNFTYGQHQGSMKTGQVARQATASIWLQLGETVVLTTVCAAKARDGQNNFLPLQVEFREKDYAKSMIRNKITKQNILYILSNYFCWGLQPACNGHRNTP